MRHLFWLLIVAVFFVGCDTDKLVEPFYKGQLVRVYGPNGSLLFVAEYFGSELPYVTLCNISPKSIGGNFKPKQCALIDTRSQYLLIDTNELWRAPK